MKQPKNLSSTPLAKGKSMKITEAQLRQLIAAQLDTIKTTGRANEKISTDLPKQHFFSAGPNKRTPRKMLQALQQLWFHQSHGR